MTQLNPNAHAVVWYGYHDAPGNEDTPLICRVLRGGLVVDGTRYAIYDDPAEATEQFLAWPHEDGVYAILPLRLLVQEQQRYVLKDAVR